MKNWKQMAEAAGLAPIKVNMVVRRGLNEESGFAIFQRRTRAEVISLESRQIPSPTPVTLTISTRKDAK